MNFGAATQPLTEASELLNLEDVRGPAPRKIHHAVRLTFAAAFCLREFPDLKGEAVETASVIKGPSICD